MSRILCFIVIFLTYPLLRADDSLPENNPLTALESVDYARANETYNGKLLMDKFKNAKVLEIAEARKKNQNLLKKLQKMYDVTLKENQLVELRIANNAERGFQLTLRNKLLFLGIWISIALVSLILIVVFWNKRVHKIRAQQFSKAAFDAREEEKRRFSRELHDDFQATLSIIHIMAAHEYTLAPENKNYETITTMTKTAMNEIRSISKELYPSDIKTLGLLESLQSLVDRTNSSQTTTQFRIHGVDFECTSELCITWFRIVQKLIKNTLNVSGARVVSMSFRIHKNGIELVYTESDFDQKGKPSKFYLRDVRDFIHSLGGISEMNRTKEGVCGLVVFFEGK